MKRNIKILLLILLMITVGLLIYKLYFKYEIHQNKIKYNRVVSSITVDNKQIKGEALKTKLVETFDNKDIIGTIKINGTTIDDVLVQGIDNEYYLNHSIDRKYNINGAIFLDSRNNINDKKLIIYGHSYKYSSDGFSQLFKYTNYSFYKQNSCINLNLNGNNSKWVIFSAMVVSYPDKKYTHTELNFNNDKEYQKHLKWLTDNSLYDTKVSVDTNDRILVIQTCYYNPSNSYFIISAKKI